MADGISIAGKGAGYGQVGDEEVVSFGKGKAYGQGVQNNVSVFVLNFICFNLIIVCKLEYYFRIRIAKLKNNKTAN